MPPTYCFTGNQRFSLLNGLSVLRISEAQEIPGGTHEGVHGVGLPLGRLAAGRAGHVDSASAGSGVPFPKIDAPGQFLRQISRGTEQHRSVQWMMGIGQPSSAGVRSASRATSGDLSKMAQPCSTPWPVMAPLASPRRCHRKHRS